MKPPELNLRQTCSVCPEQYDLVDSEEKCVAYFRLRHGYFTVECPDVGGTLVYEARPDGDGCFMPYERESYIAAAMAAVKKHYGWEDDKMKRLNQKKDSIHHKYPIYENPERDCTKCDHARQIAPHEWECDAVVYDIKGLTCFVERKNENGEQ